MKRDFKIMIVVIVSLLIMIASSMLIDKIMLKEENLDLARYEPVPYTDLSPPAAVLFMKKQEVTVIDISDLYGLGHIRGAVNYPLNDGTLVRNLHKMDREDFYLIYGHFRGPSVIASQRMVDEGFVNVYRLDGGYNEWVEYGYSFVK